MKLLDHGFIELVETWGSEERIIEAARMSTGKGFQGWGNTCRVCKQEKPTDPVRQNEGCRGPTLSWNTTEGMFARPHDLVEPPGDDKLLRYLWTHKHSTPFEMAGATFIVQAPIFVFREWHRHRTQSYNEMSARYVPLPDVNYVPDFENLVERWSKGFDTTNKQEASAIGIHLHNNRENLRHWLDLLQRSQRMAQDAYATAISYGVPKELARLSIPVARYSRMMVSTDLLNWTKFLRLRMAANAQWEIKQYANAACALLEKQFPRTIALFKEETL